MTLLANSTVTTSSTAHIAVTAAVSAAVALGAALSRLPRGMLIDQSAVALLTFAAVLLWRLSANMPQLNNDGLNGFSANDWLASVLTYGVLAAYADLRKPHEPRRFAQTRALASAAALAVNVIAI